jgi:hypothetical protein
MTKRIFQMCVVLAAMLPVTAGLWGVWDGLVDGHSSLANHARYLSGLLLAIGLAFLATVRNVEQKSELFRMLTGLVVVGGLCRLVGVALGDPLSWKVGVALAMELVVTPALCLYQGRLNAEWRRYRAA